MEESTNKKIIIMILCIVGIIVFILICKNYSDKQEYKEIIQQEKDISYNDIDVSDNSNTDYFSQLSIGEPSTKKGTINDTIYVSLTNNSNMTLKGSLKAYFFKDGNAIQDAVLSLPASGLQPNESITIDGIYNTIESYDNIKIEESHLWE